MSDLIDRAEAISRAVELRMYGKPVKMVAVSELERLPKRGETTTPEQADSDRLGVNAGETCTDAISRQAAIDALYHWEMCYTWDEHCREDRDLPYIVSPSKVIDGLPSAQPEQRWIPVSERLPEHNQRIIAYYPEHKSTMVINYNAHGFTSMSAWMPLPEPYAERRTDE